MVDNSAQMYTIEGIAAAILMVVTTYLMLSATTLYTPGETHVSDMQLEVLGNDALAMMDAPNSYGANSSLETYLSGSSGNETYYATNFIDELSNYLNQNEYGHLNFYADVSFRNISNNNVGSYHFAESQNFTGLEHIVRATRWVYVNNTAPSSNHYLDARPQTVLLEVLIWRD